MLAERKTRYYIAVKILVGKGETMVKEIISALFAFPKGADKTITCEWDNKLHAGERIRYNSIYICEFVYNEKTKRMHIWAGCSKNSIQSLESVKVAAFSIKRIALIKHPA